MHGSTGSCLLALSLMILPAGPLLAQSHRSGRPSDAAPGSALDFGLPLPRVVQPPEPIPPWLRTPVTRSGPIGLPQMAQAAGMIFSATVTAVERLPATGVQTLETVAITFHVENAIRGATPGENLTISQWVGLWSSGQHYRVGERALLFLYPPSKLGLTSCIGGPLGRFAIDPSGRILLSAQQVSAFRTDPVLGGKSRVSFRDFALAVRQATGEEWTSTTRR